MTQRTRAIFGFLTAPAIPAAALWFCLYLGGDGNASVVLPYILGIYAYAAAFFVGIPSYLILQRKEMRSLRAYVLSGALIGPAFFVIFTALTAHPGTVLAQLKNSGGRAVVAMTYSSIAAAVFWVIAFWRSDECLETGDEPASGPERGAADR